jgi:hypothetical protein
MKWQIPLLLVILILIGATACGSTQDLLPGRYGTVHEGQTWVIDLQGDGSWTGTFSGKLLTSGSYILEGEKIIWLTDSHCEGSGHPGEGTYRWKYRNDRLTFTSIGKDPCLSREVILEDEVYTLQN